MYAIRLTTNPRLFVFSTLRNYSNNVRIISNSFSTKIPTSHEPLPESHRGRVPTNIWEKTNTNLHTKPNHPLNILRKTIESHIQNTDESCMFNMNTSLSPIVTSEHCFDDLLVPSDHISRNASDTYYIDDNTLLRTHMTAHDPYLLRSGMKAALSTGDVYRRDTVDRTHYPIFHQMDAFKLYQTNSLIKSKTRHQIENDLKNVLVDLAHTLFGQGAKFRWVNTYFPFTTPSFELEILWNNDEWLEVLGCGLLHNEVLEKSGLNSDEVQGWAFGLGLERLAMILFNIPDIRLFWCTDERFVKQFNDNFHLKDMKFKPFSAFPPIEKHLSFWVNGQFHENDFCQTARAVGGDLIEHVEVIDRFQRNGQESLCFNVVFRSLHRSLTHVEVNEIYESLRQQVATNLPVTLR